MGVLQWEMVNRQSRAVPKAFGIEQMCGLAHKHLQQSQNRRRKSSALQVSSTKTKKRGLTSLSVVPPGNIYIAVMLCTSIYLALMQVKWSRFAHGLNSSFYTTLKRSYFTSPKIMIFAFRNADMLGYNCVATEPIYQTPYIASYQAERHKTALHHHGTVAACVW